MGADNDSSISSTKPDEKFLIGVCLALLFIIVVSLVFLVRPHVLAAIRRLRHQRVAVEQIIAKKRRIRKPRLYEVWVHDDWSENGQQATCPDLHSWQTVQPLAVSMEYNAPPTCNSNITLADSAPAPALDSKTRSPSQSRGSGEPSSPFIEPPLSSDETHETFRPSEIKAHIYTLISMPTPPSCHRDSPETNVHSTPPYFVLGVATSLYD